MAAIDPWIVLVGQPELSPTAPDPTAKSLRKLIAHHTELGIWPAAAS